MGVSVIGWATKALISQQTGELWSSRHFGYRWSLDSNWIWDTRWMWILGWFWIGRWIGRWILDYRRCLF